MKVRVIDIETPREDEPHVGKPTSGITLGKVYLVAEVLDDKYSIFNDEYKIARYRKIRFEVVNGKPVEPLRKNFNSLTTPARNRIKELESYVTQLEAQIREYNAVLEASGVNDVEL